jgi:hypothetical protein
VRLRICALRPNPPRRCQPPLPAGLHHTLPKPLTVAAYSSLREDPGRRRPDRCSLRTCALGDEGTRAPPPATRSSMASHPRAEEGQVAITTSYPSRRHNLLCGYGPAPPSGQAAAAPWSLALRPQPLLLPPPSPVPYWPPGLQISLAASRPHGPRVVANGPSGYGAPIGYPLPMLVAGVGNY